MKTIHFDEVYKVARTGDLILFSGQYAMSKLVEKLEGSKWSHVGMVYRPDPHGEVYLFESTALTNLEDEFVHDHKTGPKIVKLIDRLKTYGNDLEPYIPPQYAIRHLTLHTGTINSEKLQSYMNEVHGIPNPTEWTMIEEVIEGRLFHIQSKNKDYTCSKLIAETYEILGIFQPSLPLNGYMPSDFSTGGKVSLHNAALSEEQLISLQLEDMGVN
ncbi:hypothetical protein Q73_06245 [Bacillus coahuilensis m2-6]|uniref:hypothetical protein n=1 Tax=Bacillus coahuilensis TaxID=408580 RepID=UPI000750330D|nr:hypothetical protein [Bacillus coahuilensis]KUP08343.1 hypothetical protein Q73_06245 [Bacillus coahuilensis m2-6]